MRKDTPTETLRLDACGKGDHIDVPSSTCWRHHVTVELIKIKAMPQPGMVQIKFRAIGAGSKIQKADLEAATLVRRHAPEPIGAPPATIVHEGVRYRSTDGRDVRDAVADAVAARRTAIVHGPRPVDLMQAVSARLGLDLAFGGPSTIFFPPAFLFEEEALPPRQQAMIAAALDTLTAVEPLAAG